MRVRMESMSHGDEIFGLGGDAATEPSFETALRGYEKKQVERYVARAENEIAALAAEREQAYTQIQKLAGQVERAPAGDLARRAARSGVEDRGLVPAPRARGSSRSSPSPRSRPRRSSSPPPTTSPPGSPRPSGSAPRPRSTADDGAARLRDRARRPPRRGGPVQQRQTRRGRGRAGRRQAARRRRPRPRPGSRPRRPCRPPTPSPSGCARPPSRCTPSPSKRPTGCARRSSRR